MKEMRRRWGNIELVVDKVRKRRLEWLGHLVKMPDSRLFCLIGCESHVLNVAQEDDGEMLLASI